MLRLAVVLDMIAGTVATSERGECQQHQPAWHQFQDMLCHAIE